MIKLTTTIFLKLVICFSICAQQYVVGDVKYSILNPDQFRDAMGNNEWVLMDGRNISGTALASMTGMSNLPDARGQFIRAMNYDGGSDPDNREVGQAQSDATKMPNKTFQTSDVGNHGHTYKSSIHGTLLDNPHSQPYQNFPGVPRYGVIGETTSAGAGAHSHDITGGDKETRPINIALYVYIKVD